jgi:pimeloyl-ACP methyl ester carboxylesterase
MQTLHITNKHQEKLAAYLFDPPSAGGHMVVICHGFRGGKENADKICAFAAKLQELGLGVIAFDFSGSGSSEGAFLNSTLSRQASDLQAVIDYVHTEFSRPIILLGRSFGGSTVLAGGSGDERIAGYVLWSVPVHLEKTFATMLPDTYQNLLAGEIITVDDAAGQYRLHPDLVRDFARHDMDAYLQGIESRPILIIQASDDEVVDPDDALYMQERLKNCTLYMVDEAGHRFMAKTGRRENLTLDWLRSRFAI